MTDQEDDDVDPLGNATNRQSRPHQKTVEPPTKFPPYFVPRRPRVVKMRDLSPATRNRIITEYYDAYDPWTGIRTAATLGILISLFTLFLIYKSRFSKSKNTLLPAKKTSLYLYDEEDAGDVGHVGSSDDSSSYAYSFAYGGPDDRLPRGYHFGLPGEDFPLEEVFVKPSVMECVALTVHPHKNPKGPKFGTLRITEDVTRSLPCSPYKTAGIPKKSREAEEPIATQEISSIPSSCSDSITSLGSTDSRVSTRKSAFVKGKCKSYGPQQQHQQQQQQQQQHQQLQQIVVGTKSGRKSRNTVDDVTVEDSNDSSLQTSAAVVSGKRPQDYRIRSTVVAIGRRKRKT